MEEKESNPKLANFIFKLNGENNFIFTIPRKINNRFFIFRNDNPIGFIKFDGSFILMEFFGFIADLGKT